MLQRIRSEQNIRSSIVKCVKCGHVGESGEAHVSMRAMLLSVIRFESDSSGPTKAVEKRWDAYRNANGLDIYVELLSRRRVVKSAATPIYEGKVAVATLDTKWLDNFRVVDDSGTIRKQY